MTSLEKFAGRPHGTRVRYLAGCKCMLCRAANSRYSVSRAKAQKEGDWNGLVSAERARQHILYLSRAGVGRRQIERVCGVSNTVVSEVGSGRKTQIRARTEKLILWVTADRVANGEKVSAKLTWERINELLEEGFTRSAIAKRLGYRGHGLQLRRDRVLQKNAVKVGQLYRSIMCGA